MSENEKNKEENQYNTDVEKMAVNFPDWDLLPPDVLIQRKKNEQ